MIAEAGEPGDVQPGSGELLQRAGQQAGVMREAELAPEDVVAIRAGTVRLPEDIVGPVWRLDSGVARGAGIRPHEPAVEEREEVLHLVPLRVVDGVTGGHCQLGPHPGDGAEDGVERAQGGVDRMRGECFLRALYRHDLGVSRIGEVPVEELEPRRRLNVSELKVGDVNQAEQRPRAVPRGRRIGHAELLARDVRLARGDLDGPVGRAGPAAQYCTRRQPTISGQRRAPAAHGSLTAGASPDTSTGSGRIVSATWLPAGKSLASAVVSWARIVVSPRSTVTRLVAPRNVTAITVPVSGPESPELSAASVTASGRTSAMAGPGGVPRSTSGRSRPRTVTVLPLTVPASRLVRPTNSATNEVAGRE